MNAKRHPDDATLMSFAAGGLSQALAAVVAAHVSRCPHCRRELQVLDMIGTVVLRDLPESWLLRPVPVLALGSLEADIDGRVNGRPPGADIPSPIAQIAGDRLDQIAWSSLSPGIEQHELKLPGGSSGGQLKLLKIDPGRSIPEHGHGGTELTLVLRGGFKDGYGEFGPGDVADVDESIDHMPVADPVEGCICLIASEKPPKFRGLLARLVQPFLKS